MQDTCAACDAPLDEMRRNVTIGGKTVEVCCAECAEALQEAQSSITSGIRDAQGQAAVCCDDGIEVGYACGGGQSRRGGVAER